MTEVDERYKKGMIYTIRNIKDDTMIYVGSTINKLSKRLDGHKKDYKCGKSKNCSLYKYIENNDWTDWYIELFEAYSCNNKQELNRREGEIIREIGTINKCIAGRTRQEYRDDNADKINESKKKYRENNKEKISQHKTEKICCDICGTLISRHNISKHQRTQKCLAIKNLSNTDIPIDSHIVDL